MSIGFELVKTGRGWRLGSTRHFLRGWKFDYQPDQITGTPLPSQLLLMLAGVIVFWTSSIIILRYAIWPFSDVALLENPLRSAPVSRPMWLAASSSGIPIFPASQSTQDSEEGADIRQATGALLERLTRDMTPEEKAGFEARLKSVQAGNSGESERGANRDRQIDKVLTILRVFLLLPALLLFLIGAGCLYQSLLFFRNRIVITKSDQGIVVSRSRLIGAPATVEFPLTVLRGVLCQGKFLPRRRHRPMQVVWSVTMGTMDRRIIPPRFEVDVAYHTAETNNPTTTTLKFASALARLTQQPIIQSKTSQ